MAMQEKYALQEYSQETIEDQIQCYAKHIDDSIRYALALDVKSKADVSNAQDFAIQARDHYKQLEILRKKLVEPYRKVVNSINERFKTFTERFEKIEDILTAKIDSWKKKEEIENKVAKESATELSETLGIEVVPYVENNTNTITTSESLSFEKTTWKFEVENLSTVPREFLMIDEEKVKAFVKMGAREIPGLKIYSETKTILRSR